MVMDFFWSLGSSTTETEEPVYRRNCYNCLWCGDGEEVDDEGHCWLRNGDVDVPKIDKKIGCLDWSPRWK